MAEILFCNKCGTANAPGALFCSNCGASMNPAAAATPTSGAGTPYGTQAGGYQPVAGYPAPGYPAAAVGAGYGGFWIRVVAWIVDEILVRIVVTPIGLAFGGMSWLGSMGSGFPHAGFAMLGGGIMVLLVLAGGWLYHAFLESSSYQATLGKMIFGMKVTDLQGNRISFAQATGRHFAKIISWIFCIGFIMVGFTERKQGLHDVIAGTLVRKP